MWVGVGVCVCEDGEWRVKEGERDQDLFWEGQEVPCLSKHSPFLRPGTVT